MSNNHNPENCVCRTGKRRLVIITPNFEIEFAEILTFSSQTDWVFHKELDALEVSFGVEEPTKSLSGFVNFLSGLYEQTKLKSLRAEWLEDFKPIEQQLVKLIHASSLVDMVSHNSSELIDILHKRRIETWFQPIQKLSDKSVWGYECLLRGRTEGGQVVEPLEMIDWARKENLIFMLDRLSRETHLINAGKSIPDLASKHILINFLPSSVYRPEFCLRSTSIAVNTAKIQPNKVIFEVVETEEIEDIKHLNRILNHYRKIGYKVALDDVGSGFSSLNILADLNPDLIKIDISLIQRSRESSIHRDICKSLVELGHKRDRLVLAEGIETEQDKEFAINIGADLIQGFLVGKPSPEVNES